MGKCNKKRRYDTRELAEKVLQEQKGSTVFSSLAVYPCSKHKCFHLGHRKQVTKSRLLREELEILEQQGGNVMFKNLLINKNNHNGIRQHLHMRNLLIQNGVVDKFMIVSDYQTYVEYDSSSVRQAMKDLFKDGDTKTKMETPPSSRVFEGVHTHCGEYGEKKWVTNHEKQCDECKRLKNPRDVKTIASDEVTLAVNKANKFNSNATPTVYTSEFRNEAIAIAIKKKNDSDISYSQTALELGIPRSTLFGWIDNKKNEYPMPEREYTSRIATEAESIISNTPEYTMEELESKLEYHTQEAIRFTNLLKELKDKQKREQEDIDNLMKTRNEIVHLRKLQLEADRQYEEQRRKSQKVMDELIAKIDDKFEFRDSIKEDI
tara:strand:- start:428 stop:1558 length:1131 start_codon:yes stop_codon:yes gene_type:complete